LESICPSYTFFDKAKLTLPTEIHTLYDLLLELRDKI
jgi:hypothetical protein